MKTKAIIIMAAAFLAVVGVTAWAQQGGGSGTEGRYQIFGAESYDVVTAKERPFVYRIDSRTGDTWIFLAGRDGDVGREYRWVVVNEKK